MSCVQTIDSWSYSRKEYLSSTEIIEYYKDQTSPMSTTYGLMGFYQQGQISPSNLITHPFSWVFCTLLTPGYLPFLEHAMDFVLGLGRNEVQVYGKVHKGNIYSESV